jgi:Kdo2-lipid IVA lauroyltransferase/acyltransferase
MKNVLYILSILLNALPQRFLFACADGFGIFVFTVIRFRRQVILDNLKTAFGEEKSPAELLCIAKKNYQHYARVLVEIILSVTWTKEDYLKKTVPEGFENFEPYKNAKKGGFVLASHMGNWEFSIATAAALGLPCDIVVKESRTPIVENFLKWFRRKSGAGILLETGTAKEILRSLSQGRFVGFILDQYMGAPIGLPVKFFGKTAGTAAALALMTERKDTPVFVANNYRGSDGKIHIEVGPPISFGELSEDKNERLHQKTQIFNNVLESFVRQHPEQWLWLHRRWKPFIGETRWPITQKTMALTILALVLAACSSTPSATTPTGIALPADPNISTPALSNVPYDEPVPTPSPTPSPSPTPIPPVKKKKKGSVKEETKTQAPVTPPAQVASPVANKVLTIVPADKIPFEVGERVEMELKWTALPAGRAVLEVREGPVFNGRPTFHLWGNLLSSKIVDAVYHIDNTAESFIDRAGIMPYKFLLHMVESKQLKETRVAFDHAQGKAHYWAKRISERWGPQDIDRVDNLTPQARDMFSALYYARALNYKIGQKQTFIVYENSQNWEIGLLPIATELIHTPVGAFQCHKIKVTATLNNVLTPMGDTHMWLSDDSKKYLVKFDAKIKIGSLYGVLSSVKER